MVPEPSYLTITLYIDHSGPIEYPGLFFFFPFKHEGDGEERKYNGV